LKASGFDNKSSKEKVIYVQKGRRGPWIEDIFGLAF